MCIRDRYWSLLDDLNIQPYDKLCMNLKKSVGSGWCSSLIALEDVHGKEMKLSLERYLGPIDEEGWHSIEVPLIAFAGVLDTEHIKCFSLTFQHSKGYNRGRILLDNLRFKTTKKDIILVDDFESGNFRHNFLGQGAYDFSNGAAAFKARLDQERHPGDHGTTLLLSYGGSIGLDMKEAGFSFCGIHTGLGGLDASSYEVLSFRIRGNKGGETPNVYLTDGICKKGVDVEKYSVTKTEWNTVEIPLSDFTKKGIDLTHLEGLEFIFEWEECSGTIWLDDIKFKQVAEYSYSKDVRMEGCL